MPEIVTANRLCDGVVVFLDEASGWSEDFARAAVAQSAEASAAALTQARRAEADNLVVEPYAAVVELRNGHYVPTALREAIRASGPTVRRDLGKQAAGLAPHPATHSHPEAAHVSL